MRRLGRLGPAAALLAALLAALPAGRAAAHAQLVAAEPPANAVLAEPPAEVVLEFSEPVEPLVLRWFPAGGAAPLPAQPRAEGSRLVLPVPAGLGEGTQILSWRVVSADGHPVAGSHVFSIGTASGTAGPPTATASAARAAAARGLLTLALVLGVGGAVFLRLVDRGAPVPRHARALARLAAWTTLPAAVLALGAHGLDLLGAAPAQLAGWAPWRAALASPFAATAAASLLAALAAAAALRRDGAAARASAAAAWALAALSFACFGHAATAPPRWLTAPAVALHAAAFVFWIGALPGLAERAAAGPALPTLRRFSALALPLVAGLALSGALLALIQLGRPQALVDTAYGRLLAAKLALVALLLLLAALNRYQLIPRMAAGGAAAAHGTTTFRRSVAAELLLGLLILALASGFRMTPPPRALAAAASAPQAAHAHAHGRTVMAGIMLTPGRAGANMVEIAVETTDQAPLDPLEVTLAFSDPARGVEQIRLPATRDAGRWRVGPVQLPHPGEWTLTIDILVSDFAKETLATDIEIAP